MQRRSCLDPESRPKGSSRSSRAGKEGERLPNGGFQWDGCDGGRLRFLLDTGQGNSGMGG